jgi:hypothetical protein
LQYKQEVTLTEPNSQHETGEPINDQDTSFNTFAFGVMADYVDIPENNIPTEQEDPEMDREMREYAQELAPPFNVDVLNWWSERTGKFRLLSTLARFVLAIPASSAAPERNLSMRSHLSSSTIEDTLICNSNADLLG